MKNTLLILSAIFVLASCGKYEKPFISFKSPEKRLTDKTWKVDKILDIDGNEVATNEKFSFTIEGEDSILVRTIDGITYTGNWNWLPAIEGKVDKQRIVTYINTPFISTSNKLTYDVKTLTSKELVMINMDGGVTANYKYYLTKE
jgi:hypothetical protein